MSRTARRRQAPGGYRLRVEGHLDQRWSAWFDDLTLTREGDGTTSLSGAVTDQAELHGLLMKIRDLGVLIPWRPSTPTAADPPRAPSAPSAFSQLVAPLAQILALALVTALNLAFGRPCEVRRGLGGASRGLSTDRVSARGPH